VEGKTVYSSKRGRRSSKKSAEEPIILRQSVFVFVFKIFLVELLLDFLYVMARIPELYFNLSTQVESELVPDYFFVFVVLAFIRLFVVLIIALYWITTQYIVTKGEIIFRRGVLNVTEKMYSIAHIQEVICRQDYIGRLLNYGTLEIYSPSISERMYFYQIPDPKKYERIINSYLVESEKVSYTPERK
jgi:uncharacterized membrane protein YdbT with pleckstrin-like domain